MKKYQVIYADPPWEYKAGRCLTPNSLLSGDKQVPYKYMTLQDICNLPVNRITDSKCLLFLWTTAPKLNIAFDVITAWGFEYSTIGFVWEKENTNPGYYTLSSVELCLIARKGGIPKPRGLRNIRQFLQEKRKKHSQKPKTIRDRIVQMFPTQEKIELFAREKVEGWTSLGYDINGKGIKESLQELARETNE